MKAIIGSMTVGALAKQAGVKIDTIRYYERRGLLLTPPRTNSGYRTFTPASIDRLRFIKEAQALGFTLTEVNQLLALRLSPGVTCTDVRERAQAKVAEIEQKIQSLRTMKQALQHVVSACVADGPARKCSFLANLYQGKLP
jgi:MerR family transcriptional regulator, copper efflux regulator